MEMSELTAYAKERYDINEQQNWAEFPGLSVLCHPRTGKWIALLMRQWDTETGMEIERCDLKCGKQVLAKLNKPYLSAPVRMHGPFWINIAFGSETESEVILALFDQAVSIGVSRGYTIVLDSPQQTAEAVYHDTPLPVVNSIYQQPKKDLPERIRQLRSQFVLSKVPAQSKAKAFFQQAKFMEDYEDDAPLFSDFLCYFPTYSDLSIQQLRGYFSWRALVRRGEFQPIAASAAYLYVYELLNGIGASSPEDSLRKLKDFEAGFLNSETENTRMRANLQRWMMEFAILHDLPPETARQYTDPNIMKKDSALLVLREPRERSDDEVYSALRLFAGKKLPESQVMKKDADRGKHLFSEAWRVTSARYRQQDKDLFTLCFGTQNRRLWYPLSNAVYYQQERQADMDYVLDDCRSYRCRNGVWEASAYEALYFDSDFFLSFLRAVDLRLRRYLETGHYLREKPSEEWAIPYIDAVIEEDQRAMREASRPKITIDFSGLDQIRQDALATRDSLLTSEDMLEDELPEDASDAATDTVAEDVPPDLPLDSLQVQILRTLLRGDPADGLIREHRLTRSLVADFINEALFDDIGDVVLACENDTLSIVEDYREDLAQMLGGTPA